MVLINITKEEIQALDEELYSKIECKIKIGLILGLLRVKIQEKLNLELKKKQKAKAMEILDVKKKP